MKLLPSQPRKIELHLTYRCDLSCSSCNRACFYKGPLKAPDLTIEDTERFIQECEPLIPRFSEIVVLGGEPTLNPDCVTILRRLQRLRRLTPEPRLWLTSNGYSDLAQSVIRLVDAEHLAIVDRDYKTAGSTASHPRRTMFMRPADFGLERVSPCPWHSWGGCGISVDSLGYTICPSGGMISDILGLNVRRPRLADMFNQEIAQEQTDILCNNCGAFCDELFARHVQPTDHRIHWHDWTPVSETWHNKLVKHE